MAKRTFKPNELIPFSEIPGSGLIPPRRKKSKLAVATLYRWASKGRAGVRLRVAYAGATPCTTPDWLRQFFESVGSVEFAAEPISDASTQSAAEAELQRVGAM